MKTQAVLLLFGMAACAPKSAEQTGDSASAVAAIDTLKPAAETMGAQDSLGGTSPVAGSTTGTKAASTSGSTKTSTGTKTAPRDTTNIGRDVAIPLDTKNPKVYLPTVDTARKRPPR